MPPLNPSHVVSLDIETSGVDSSKHSILSVGGVHVESGAEFYAEVLWREGVLATPEASRVHGLQMDRLDDGTEDIFSARFPGDTVSPPPDSSYVVKRQPLVAVDKALHKWLEQFRPGGGPRIVGLGWNVGCVTPKNRVLTADLRWVPADQLVPGDELLAFTDNSDPHSRRKWCRSVVLVNNPLVKSCAKVTLSDGTQITTTWDHPWMVPGNRRFSNGYRWRTTEVLQKKLTSPMNRLLPTWSEGGFKEGWLSGFFDGEGTISQWLPGKKGYKNSWAREGQHQVQLGCSQRVGPALDRALSYLRDLGFRYSVRAYDKEQSHMRAVRVLGGTRACIEFVGRTRPAYFLAKMNPDLLPSLKTEHENKPEMLDIVSIEDVGEQVVSALGTSTGTYIAEGFGMHNSFDVPWIRSHMARTAQVLGYRSIDLNAVCWFQDAVRGQEMGWTKETVRKAIPNVPPHNALGDARQAAAIWRHLTIIQAEKEKVFRPPWPPTIFDPTVGRIQNTDLVGDTAPTSRWPVPEPEHQVKTPRLP